MRSRRRSSAGVAANDSVVDFTEDEAEDEALRLYCENKRKIIFGRGTNFVDALPTAGEDDL
jgi:hypothetical protein